MGLINPPEVHPAIVRALYRVCIHRGAEHSASLEELLELLAPTGIVGSGDNARLAAQRTIREATRLGILAHDPKSPDDYCLALPAPAAELDAVDAERFIIRRLRNLVFDQANNSDLFGTAGGATADSDGEQIAGETLVTTGAREFTRIQAWLYTHDPLGKAFIWGGADKQRRGVQQAQSQSRNFVVNNTRWNAFRRWSLYLGLSRQDGATTAGVIPDPTVAILDELADLRGDTPQRPLSEFRTELGKRLPVLDTGAYRKAVLADLGQQDDEATLSRPLVLALTRLERRGLVTLEQLADYAGATFELGVRKVTHITFGEPA
jgi:hypothetical protein